MKYAHCRKVSRIAPTVCIALAVFATAWLPLQASAAEETPRRAIVYCMVDKDSIFPFPAGNNFCFKEINGKTSVYKSAAVCAYDAAAAAHFLRFLFSVMPKATCMDGYITVAKKDDYRWGLDKLSAEEKAFILKHVDAQ